MKNFFDRFSRWIVALVVALAAALGAAGGASYTGAIAGKASHIYQLTTVTSMIAGTSVASGTTMIAGSSVAAGTSVTAGSTVKAGTKFIATPASAITCANGATITPTGTFQPLTASGTVAVTLSVTSRTTGEILILWNSAAQAITITDTNIDGTGALALSQFDTAWYIFSGTNWAQLGTSDN